MWRQTHSREGRRAAERRRLQRTATHYGKHVVVSENGRLELYVISLQSVKEKSECPVGKQKEVFIGLELL